jgi:hypothetical protein
MEHSPKLASATSPCPRENAVQTSNTGAAITPLSDFSFLRNPFIKNHLPHPSAQSPPPAVRFEQAKTDNQSAGKLRLGFHPSTQPVAAPFAEALALPAPFIDNRIHQRTPPARFPAGAPSAWAPAILGKSARPEAMAPSGQTGQNRTTSGY